MLAVLRICPKCRTEYDPPHARCAFDGESLVETGYEDREDTPPFGTPIVAGALGELGPYRLLSVLGEGTMAVVYAAEHVKLGRRCAIKRLRPEHLVDTEMVQRFIAEARTVASIQHPNLVTIYDVVEEPGEAYLVMELLDGRDLQTVLQTGSLAIDRALRIAYEVCEALAPVHARGIVHRDVKPANVFLCINGGREQVKMLDFGAARLLGKQAMAAEQRLQQDGTTLGSPMYMSPEQITGEPLDPRSDLYSVGVVLYEMISGVPPFTGETFSDVMLQHLHHAPRHLLERGAAVSTEIDRLVQRCLEKRPDRRPQSAADLSRELRRLGGPLIVEGSGGTIPALLPSSAPAAVRPWMLGVGATIALVAVAAVGLGFRSRGVATAAPALAAPAGATAAARVSPPVPLTAPPPAPTPTSIVPFDPANAPSPRPGMRIVRVETTPSGATAEPEDGRPGCATPCVLELPAARSLVTLQKAGFRDEQVSVGAKEGLVRLTMVKTKAVAEAKAQKSTGKAARSDSDHISGSETLNPFGEQNE